MTDAKAVIEQARQYFFSNDFNCCESVLKALKDAYDLPYGDEVLRLATGMAAGAGGGCMCSALSATTMTLGMIYGRSRAKADKSRLTALCDELYAHYSESFMFNCCRTQMRQFPDHEAPEAKEHCFELMSEMIAKACEIIDREGIPEQMN